MTQPLKKVTALFKRSSLLLTVLIIVVLTMTAVTVASLNLMSTLRAYADGESLWSKAQKEAILLVVRYADTHAEVDFGQFRSKLRVADSYRRARLEMNQPSPSMSIIRESLVEGGINAEDVDAMVWVYRHFKSMPDAQTAIAFWESADLYITQLGQLGEGLHNAVLAGRPGLSVDETRREIARINMILTPIEAGFSDALGKASRQTRSVLVSGISLVALGLIILSFFAMRALIRHGNRLEQQLRESEERLILGFKGSNAGLWDWDIVADKVYYSPWIVQLLGYTGDSMPTGSQHFVDLIHPDDRDAARQALAHHLRTSARYEVKFRLRTQSGEYRWCRSRGQAIRDDKDRPVRMVGSMVDITELMHAEAAAYTEKELAGVTLAAIADAVITTDTEGRITFCNKVGEMLLGQTAAQIHQWPLVVACRIFNEATGEEIDDLVGAALRDEAGPPLAATLFLQRLDATTVPIHHSVAPIRNASGEIVGAVVVLRDVSEGRRQAEQLAHQATHDALTGAVNRREFERQLTTLLAYGGAHRQHAVLYLDLDQFKIINDTCGHAAGDELICQVTLILQQRLRDGDLLARLGGDEFGIILKNCVEEHAFRVAEQLRKGVAEIRFTWGSQSFTIAVSIGLVMIGESLNSLKEVMRAADAACYLAKEKGRNRIHLYSENDQELSQRQHEIAWATRIRTALDENTFCLYAQPITALQPALATPSRIHIEILLRMLDEDGSLIPPMAFIPAADRFDLMGQIDRWVIRHAFRQLSRWQLEAPMRIATCSINLSASSISDDEFIEFVLIQQQEHQIPWTMICFEISEPAAIANLSKAAILITKLHELGCRFALDDFGAGMSSFSYLKHLPVDYLKIDGRFVKDMLTDPVDHAMVAAINQIGHLMGKKTIAESVESRAVRTCLAEMGIDYAQGMGIATPAPAEHYFTFDETQMAIGA